NSDIACFFGEGGVHSDSKDVMRMAFNSPFWPFVLSTTSVGQEGLDFHLYCKDIYHWNLPSSPVAFEQREGRINRYNNLMIRRNMVDNQLGQELGDSRMIWDAYFRASYEKASACDRVNLGMSPHWIY